ncbi:hypothetical protein FF38_04749 [Lucilia cuprina]|uniref:Uncharacterized protein n=1 Tax=Lucilia cuprina TaxID=7375 RepID=A0A0L0CPF7_LUCCU|nr:hypothetical protein FF38_04749 [Lucilia cuprina]
MLIRFFDLIAKVSMLYQLAQNHFQNHTNNLKIILTDIDMNQERCGVKVSSGYAIFEFNSYQRFQAPLMKCNSHKLAVPKTGELAEFSSVRPWAAFGVEDRGTSPPLLVQTSLGGAFFRHSLDLGFPLLSCRGCLTTWRRQTTKPPNVGKKQTLRTDWCYWVPSQPRKGKNTRQTQEIW